MKKTIQRAWSTPMTSWKPPYSEAVYSWAKTINQRSHQPGGGNHHLGGLGWFRMMGWYLLGWSPKISRFYRDVQLWNFRMIGRTHVFLFFFEPKVVFLRDFDMFQWDPIQHGHSWIYYWATWYFCGSYYGMMLLPPSKLIVCHGNYPFKIGRSSK